MGNLRSREVWTRLRVAAGLLLWVLAALWTGGGSLGEAQVSVTTVSDTIYNASGAPASGTVLISWNAFTTVSGQSVPAGSTAVTLAAGGKLNVTLAPNGGATPAGTYYTVVYHLNDGSTSRDYWTIPVSASPLSLSAVKTSVLPTSVAVQTVSKQYVDQAIARLAASGGGGTGVTGDGSGYVLKTGDTMTGALTLPADPVSALQAATKNYVDTTAAALQGGLSQKVSTLPQATQTVTQPAGTQLQVNNLNGQLYAKQYQSQQGNDGITNALSSSDCTAGCTVVADPTYAGSDAFSLRANRSKLTDQRGGAVDETYFNPQSPRQSATQGRSMTNNQTLSATASRALGYNTIQSSVLQLRENALTGGNNVFPQNLTSNIPYFKSTYGATNTIGYNTTQGQHVLDSHQQDCYGVGDCLLGSHFLYSSSGNRDNSDEGTHPFDIQIAEHTSVYRGNCASGCTTGSTQLQITATGDNGTQGDGRFLIDKAAGKVISSGTLIGGTSDGPLATAQFSGTAFPVSTFYSLASAALPQNTTMAPGTINAAIQTGGVPAGYSTNTASAPAASGVACVDDAGSGGAANFELVNYTVTDGTHIQLAFLKPHAAGATVALGGLCGYGLEQTVDTINGLRQLFPVVGSSSATSLLYSGLGTKIVGMTGLTGGYVNIQASLTSLQRSGNVVTATTAGNLPQDVNGLSLTIAGVTDASYNGTYSVSTTAANQFTYTQTGPDSSSSGGSANVLTGGYVLYPMAEVLSVYNTATRAVDGAMTLGANRVAWAAGDPVEEPHFFQNRMAADTSYVNQFLPRGTQGFSAGVTFGGVNSAFMNGWSVVNNSPASSYFGNGGTHAAPNAGMVVQGPWKTSLDLQAGESDGILVRCNSHGCGKWNSAYNLFTLQSSQYFDYVNFAPNTSTMTYNMRGSQYSFSPTAFTAGTINATTINATRINGLQAASSSAIGGVTLGAAATTSRLANIASTGNAADITSGTIDPARLPAGYGNGGGTTTTIASNCGSNVDFSATPTFAVSCSNPVFHIALSGNVTSESFTGLSAGQHITLVFQVGSTGGYTVQWSPAVHGGFLTSSTAGAAGYTQAGKYFVQQLIVDTDGATLLNPGAINE
ncbi:MAG: hypothetical protein ACRYF4_10675 [Janthinobacterium lividum]